jgi:hypothetical protein
LQMSQVACACVTDRFDLLGHACQVKGKININIKIKSKSKIKIKSKSNGCGRGRPLYTL